MESKNKRTKDILYYDGTCPLCSREISLLKKLTKPRLNFVDIHTLNSSDENIPKKEILLRILHLQQADGKWLMGLDANVAAWSYTNYGYFFKVLRWPIIKQVADIIYTKWAGSRFNKRYRCSVCPTRPSQ